MPPAHAIPPLSPLADLHSTRAALRAGEVTLEQVWQESLAVAGSSACQHVFLKPPQVPENPVFGPIFKQKTGSAGVNTAQAAMNLIATELAGLPVSIKDLFDVAGQITAAGSTVLAAAQPAAQDCPAVARLRTAGAGLMGRTNMTEFAFSGVGVNPHHGTPVNPADGQTPRIPGGSSSGAAVSVATGAAFVGLGSDTGGSLRIPAALCGVVGYKPTAASVPTSGCVPLSTTLDSVGAMTRSVRDATLVHEILCGHSLPRGTAALASYRLAVPQSIMLDALEPAVARAFERALSRLSAAGARLESMALPEMHGIAKLQAKGGFSAPEALAWHQAQGLWSQRAAYDPRVAQRIAAAETMSAADYIELTAARSAWVARFEAATKGFDALLSPTVPITAPSIASVAPGHERDAEFFRVNSLLLRNTSAVNFADGCALSLPCHAPGELPVGLMVWSARGHDASVLAVSAQIEAILG
jgi:aspartyl-tRNA(Asn)/glutamyl-tRNA(Gln) amidotransferase subunit A